MTPHELAITAQNLKSQFDLGLLNQSEFKELVNNVIIVETINNDALLLEENIVYHTIIDNIIDIASALV